MEPRQIFTLDARDNVLLEVVSKYSDVAEIYKTINSAFDELVSLLEQKGIKYGDLKNTLIPQHNKREVAVVFNRLSIESGWYGYDVFEKLIPLLSKESSHSILCGDMLGFEHQQEKIKEQFLKDLIKVRDFKYEYQNQFYLVYLNNLTDEMVRNIHEGLTEYVPYVGYLDLTYNSFMKTYLSLVLTNCCLKFKKTIICGHEPDRDESEDVNMSGYPFEENGYECRSINDMYYDLFLSYKIERQSLPAETDTMFSLNALGVDIHPMSDLNIVIEEAKLEYLLREKEANLKRAELSGLTAEELAAVIKSKIELNYIYNLTYLAEHDVLKFNVMIDTRGKKIDLPVKLVASFEYQPKSKNLRLITLF